MMIWTTRIFSGLLCRSAVSVIFTTANNGEDALQKLQAETKLPDIIFLDIISLF